MKIKFLSLLLGLALILSGLTACSGSAAKQGTPAKGAAQDEVKAGETAVAQAEESSENAAPAELKKVDFILDWTPNTNHSGLYVAKAKGYLAEVGIDLDIKQPPEDSTSDLIINNKAPFGIYFQDSMAGKLAKGAPLVALAAIVEHNTSGVIATAKSGIKEPKDLAGKRYGTWNDPIELAMIEEIMKQQGADFQKLELVPNTDSNSITSMENNLFDAAWIYYGWDGIMAETLGFEKEYFYFKDYAPELDFYSPIIISNETYLKENAAEAKAIIQAIKKGYQYAMAHPEEAADILIENAPELKEKRDFVVKSQQYLSQQYAADAAHWGEIDPARWNAFYQWVNEHKITSEPIPENSGFSNDFLN